KPIRAYWDVPSHANREALRTFLSPKTTLWQYTHGVPNPTSVSPDGYSLDNFYLARPGADEVQLDLLGDYKSNVASILPSRSTSGRPSRPSWRSGARTIRFSYRPVRRRSGATFPARSSASSTPATSHWKRMLTRSRRRFATSSPPRSA